MQMTFSPNDEAANVFSAAMMEAHRSSVLQMLVDGRPLTEILTEIVTGIERILPDATCSILLVTPDGAHLTLGAAPGLPADYNAAVEGIRIEYGAGSCGTAAFSGKRVVVEDIAHDPLWTNFRDAARRAKLASCWSQPVLDPHKRVMGTFAVYHAVPGGPDRAALQVIDHASSLTAIAIDRDRATRELERHRQHLEELVAERSKTILHLNAELRDHAQAADAANRAKGSFLANMSHEIRTPLNAVLGLSFLIAEDATDPVLRQRIEKIIAAGQHLLGTIDTVLDLSKIDAGKFTLNEAPFDLDALVANVCTIIEERATAKGLRITAEVPALPFKPVGDEVRLKQALINYAANAVKFSQQGEIRIRVTADPVDQGHATLRFEVQDQGEGIPPEAMSRLFTAFEQADGMVSRTHGGTGLGLAITRKIALMMGGDAGATSALGKGSTFWFTVRLPVQSDMPTVPEQTAGLSPRDRLRAGFAGQRILLAEDEPINADIAASFLRAAGLAVDHATDGLQAVSLARSCAYAAVLMDMQMPGLDGIGAASLIRQLAQHAHTPIIAMTANAFTEDRDRCLAAGMNAFVTKPVLPNVLYSHLLALLQPNRR